MARNGYSHCRQVTFSVCYHEAQHRALPFEDNPLLLVPSHCTPQWTRKQFASMDTLTQLLPHQYIMKAIDWLSHLIPLPTSYEIVPRNSFHGICQHLDFFHYNCSPEPLFQGREVMYLPYTTSGLGVFGNRHSSIFEF